MVLVLKMLQHKKEFLTKNKLQSSPTGPAEQFAGGSFSKSCNSFLEINKILRQR